MRERADGNVPRDEQSLIELATLSRDDPRRVAAEIEDVVGIDCSEALLVSAKTGEGVDALLEAIVQRLPPPSGQQIGRAHV